MATLCTPKLELSQIEANIEENRPEDWSQQIFFEYLDSTMPEVNLTQLLLLHEPINPPFPLKQ